MSRFFFMQRVLSMLSSGLVFRRVYAGILRAVAILVGVGGAALWVGRWSEVAELRRLGYYYSISGSATLAGVVVQILLIVLLYCWIHTIWLRARTVEELTDTGYVIAPIFSVTLKLVGELMACASVFSGLAGGLSIWIAGRNILHLLGLGSLQLGGLSPASAGFLGGLVEILSGFLLGFVALVVFYYSAERVVVLVDIAGNTRELVRKRDSNGE